MCGFGDLWNHQHRFTVKPPIPWELIQALRKHTHEKHEDEIQKSLRLSLALLRSNRIKIRRKDDELNEWFTKHLRSTLLWDNERLKELNQKGNLL